LLLLRRFLFLFSLDLRRRDVAESGCGEETGRVVAVSTRDLVSLRFSLEFDASELLRIR
jgi:hypothetical protein